jgi:hypothetical protein
MRRLEQILSCCSVFAIVSISVGGIAEAIEPLSMGHYELARSIHAISLTEVVELSTLLDPTHG